MKSLIDIFAEQLRTGELWKRVWDLSRFKKFKDFKEYKARVSRVITKEDAPAIIITLLIGIAFISLLSVFFKGRNLSLVILGTIAGFRITQPCIDSYLKKKK